MSEKQIYRHYQQGFISNEELKSWIKKNKYIIVEAQKK